ncbi:MAG: hypothetical protein ACMXYK_01305, partial [Candidatus Woesearchaeota archaeon]
LDDINDTIHQIQKDIYPIPSQQESNFNPIQGGEVPPTFSTQGQTSNNTLNLNASQGTNNTNTTDSNAPPPFSLNAKPATIPEKKKGFLKK